MARRQVNVPKVRSRNIELGINYGFISVEDFGTNPSWGLTAAYHITEDFFFQAEYGRTKAGKTSFETLNGGVELLTDLRGISRITICPSATTSCLARPFSVAAPP